MGQALWDYSERWDWEVIEHHGLCFTNCEKLWFAPDATSYREKSNSMRPMSVESVKESVDVEPQENPL
jgi:hypothetical protein